MDVGRISAETRRVTVEFAGETAAVAYRPHAFTLGLSRAFTEAQRLQDMDGIAGTLSKLIADWDLTMNGEPIPVTPEGISVVPSQLLAAIEAAIAADLQPSSAEGKASFAPSPSPPTGSTQDSAISPDGSETSPSQNGSESPSPTSSAPLSIGLPGPGS